VRSHIGKGFSGRVSGSFEGKSLAVLRKNPRKCSELKPSAESGMKVFSRFRATYGSLKPPEGAVEGSRRCVSSIKSAAGAWCAACRSTSCEGDELQIDTTFLADLIQNIQYDSADHSEYDTLHQTKLKARLNNCG
jgi:hypothetical protein